jgi:hypothetical protein
MDDITNEQVLEYYKAYHEQNRKLLEIIHYLGFKNVSNYEFEPPTVSAKELWEVLSDDEKRQKLISLVKNKAFW